MAELSRAPALSVGSQAGREAIEAERLQAVEHHLAALVTQVNIKNTEQFMAHLLPEGMHRSDMRESLGP